MRLQGEDSLGLDVTVTLLLLVADSRLARAVPGEAGDPGLGGGRHLHTLHPDPPHWYVGE